MPWSDVSYLTPKARSVDAGMTGRGSVAIETIHPGEFVVAFGGRCMPRSEFDLLPEGQQSRSIQIGDELFLAGHPEPEVADFVNHSCEPNCGMSGATIVVAMRSIDAGEELTYDYAMSDGSDYDEFECRCGAGTCRGKVTGHDWLRPDLQQRYRGWFSPYLAARIERLAARRPLSKSDVERLLAGYDSDPVATLTAAMRVVLGHPHADFATLVDCAPFPDATRRALREHDPSALDVLATTLNELRTIPHP